ncbi:DUF3566 domain-containing protein [Actinospica sp. MGRD01-02]|uniref:DUF3566 domain-containing protein n=1 Tax=Actinospica acidithermotolerans TaxID=2828514 RepID=A0A941E6Q7_9ACTN|nr:DUF3566 domain-containing protein [Actinospica acidithermotolerans]MBR7824812.1 DUF3566 domain-containing protein [Actinospica acidithermotolerans]
MSDSVNPAGSRPGGGRGYGGGVPARPEQPVPHEPGAGPVAAPAGSAQQQGPQVSGFGRTLGRMGNAVAAGVQTASGAARSGFGGAPGERAAGSAARPVGSQVRVRKARLRVAHVDPWSVMKVSFVLSIALGIVTLVGTAVVWEVLNALGVFSSLDKTVGDLTSGSSGSSSFNLSSVLSFGRVEGYMLIIALVDVVLVTALATLGAYLYNLSSGFVGGLEVTLAEDQ